MVDGEEYIMSVGGSSSRAYTNNTSCYLFILMCSHHFPDIFVHFCVSWQSGDLSVIETAYTQSLASLDEEEKTAELQQSLAEFYMDIGLFDAAKLVIKPCVTRN